MTQGEDSKQEEEDEEEWTKKYATKTSYVLELDGEKPYNMALESVLQHHQEAVSSLRWSVAKESSGKEEGEIAIDDLRLLSSSFDFTVSVW